MLKDISRKSKTYCEVSKLYEIIFWKYFYCVNIFVNRKDL